MKLRDVVMWLAMAGMVAGLYWLHTVHMIRTNFNLFLTAVIAMSAVITIAAWLIRPQDEETVSGGEEATETGGNNNNKKTESH